MHPAFARLALGFLLGIGVPQISAAESPPPFETGSADRIAPATAPALGDDDRTRLDAGAILIRDLPPSDAGGIGVLVMGTIDAPPDRVWIVMSDCEEQDEFLPRIDSASVRDRDGDSHTCNLVVDLPLPFDDLRTATRQHVRRLPDGGHQRRWELLPGDWSYLRDDGSWSVHPWAEGRRSLLVNRMDLLPKSVTPAWLLRAAHTRQAPETFDAIRARVRDLLAQKRVP